MLASILNKSSQYCPGDYRNDDDGYSKHLRSKYAFDKQHHGRYECADEANSNTQQNSSNAAHLGFDH